MRKNWFEIVAICHKRMVSSPTLYRLAANREYESIPLRVASHPEDILWTDRYGSTCLHILCQARANVDDALLHAVRTIVEHRPDVVAWANVATWTPLHFAVEKRLDGTASNIHSSIEVHSSQYRTYTRRTVLNNNLPPEQSLSCNRNNNNNNIRNSTERNSSKRKGRNRDEETMSTCTRLVLMLIEACPHAVSVRTKTGLKTKTPFHIACEADADYRVLRAMLLINPILAVQPFVRSSDIYAASAENPLQLLWKNHHSQYSYHGSTQQNVGNQELKDKMALLLHAAHYGTVQQFRPSLHSFRLLNAACSVRCPKDYVALVLRQHADQLVEKDEKGLLPLHYAVRNAEPDSPSYTQFIVQALLKAHPEAASVTDDRGRLPLHVAVGDVGLTWHKGGVQELCLQYPNALRTFDPLTGLLPFLQSAEHAINSRLHLSTTLELLLAAPEMVHPWKQKQLGGKIQYAKQDSHHDEL